MAKNWIELFEGLMKEEIPFDGTGYIINAVFDTKSNYTKIEIIAFKNVKNVLPSDTSVTFQSDGYKTFIVFEPRSFQYRFQEPYLRDGKAHVPMRWNELDTINLATKDRIFISHDPFMSYGSFTLEKPESGDFVYYFFNNEDVIANMDNFISTILHKDLRVPKTALPEILDHLHRNIDSFKNAE